MSRRPRLAGHVLGSAVLAFLVLPILAVIPASFNHSSFIRLPPAQVSLRWYRAFLDDPEWFSALLNSLKVATGTTLLAVVLGTLAALGLERASPRVRALVHALMLSPLVVPVIMISIALYYVLRPIGLHGTAAGLVIGHTLLALPFVVINVSLALRGINPDCLRAAEGLGSSPARVFRTVTLPLIVPGLAGGAAFAFITSFDEVVISIFLAGSHAKTLPVKMWEVIRVEFTPVTAVASTILIAITLLLFAGVHLARAGHRPAGSRT
jgi:putative spermidine/putrescine transport system permease protein